MKIISRCILILFCLSFTFSSLAQYNPKNVCVVKDGRICFKLDKRWTNKQKKEISTLFSLDSLLIAKSFGGKSNLVYAGINWEIKRISPDIIELSKAMDDTPAKYRKNDILMVDEKLFSLPAFYPAENADYGINKFTPENIFHYSKGEALFYLPGFKNVKQAIISGSFNNWSTSQIPMLRTSTGWFVKLKLEPGKYQYKYILDGKWVSDPYNQLKQDDLNGDFNSVVFCYNYCFRLKGYTSSHKVYVAGSFNNWTNNELKMYIHENEWILPVYLRPGTHAYKFITDNRWITDPGNKITRPDGKGNLNSFLGIGDTILFRLTGNTAAKKVILTGDFNGWNRDELVMEKTSSGWKLPYTLASGNYQYKFIVDGKWIVDPANPFTVGKDKDKNSWLAFNASHTFVMRKYPNAREVIISGSFNGWLKDGYRMQKQYGEWSFPIFLNPGKYTYKFIVDSKWIIDPGNELWEENELGTGNSVLWIEP